VEKFIDETTFLLDTLFLQTSNVKMHVRY